MQPAEEQHSQEPFGKGNFRVTSEVVIPPDAYHQLGHPSVSGHAIQISVKDPEAHFIQFVTRLCPDIVSFDMGFTDRVKWDSQLDTHYMPDSQTPRWRVDSAAHPNPYYEAQGARLLDASGRWLSIYDEPGLGLEEERVAFCTFLISQDRVFKEIQWARQTVIAENNQIKTIYQVATRDVDRLPDWALKTLNDDYNTNKPKDEGRGKIVYNIPLYLNHPITKPDAVILEDAKASLLPQPPNWCSKIRYPDLFTASAPVNILTTQSSTAQRAEEVKSTEQRHHKI